MGKEFGDRLAEKLKSRGMTQKKLAEKAGITEAAMSHYIKGDRIPRAGVPARIAEELGTTSEYLLIDFAFWMQEHYREGDPETGLIKVVFKNVRSFQIPPNTEWGETSILEMGEEDRYVRFWLINDMTDDSLEILIETDEVEVRIL